MSRRYVAEILPIRRKTLSNQSIKQMMISLFHFLKNKIINLMDSKLKPSKKSFNNKFKLDEIFMCVVRLLETSCLLMRRSDNHKQTKVVYYSGSTETVG